jgi:hypothetical protein
MNHDRTDKSLPTLFADLTRDIVDLLRKEVALGRAELAQKVSHAQSGVSSIAIGAAIAMAGMVILLLAAVNGVAMVLPPDLAPWLAPLIVGGVVVLIGYLMLKSGQSNLTAEKLVPQRTLNSLRADSAVVADRAGARERAAASDIPVHRRVVVEERTS